MKISRRLFGRLATAGALAGTGIVATALPCPAYAQRKVFKMKMGTPFPTTHPGGSRVVEVCDLIRQETKGVIDIGAFPNNQLGGESDMDSQLRSGAIEFMTTSGAVLQTVVPTSGISAVPYVFKNYDHVWSSMDGALGQYITDAVAKYGITMFSQATIDNGFRNITTSTKPINSVDDLKGFKIPRAGDAALGQCLQVAGRIRGHHQSARALFRAADQGRRRRQENPLVQINAFRLYEVQKFCSMTGHVWDGNLVVANTKKWEAIPKELQAIITRNFREMALKQRVDTFKMNNDLVGEMSQKGLVFNTPDGEPFRQTLIKAGFYTEWKAKYGPEAWGALEKAVGTTLG